MVSGKELNEAKLPTLTKIAAWLLIIMATIVCLLSVVVLFAIGCSSNADVGMAAPLIFIVAFGIAVWYFLPGILLFKSRNKWVWILAVAMLCAGILIPFALLLRDLFDFINWGLPPEYLRVEYNYIYFMISFLIPLVLVLLNKLSYKVVVLIPIPISLVIIFLCCFNSVRSEAGSYHDQATAFDIRMYTELHDLYGEAVEDRDTKGCKGCEEVNQYFIEEWNQLDPNVREQSRFDTTNSLRHRACLMTIAYFTENISICQHVAEIDCCEGTGCAGEKCRISVEALVADNVTLCDGDYECTVIFAIMTDNPSLCNGVSYKRDSCYSRYNNSQEDPYNYLGLGWSPP